MLNIEFEESLLK